jgi:methyltransferase (TIGR00027 family)
VSQSEPLIRNISDTALWAALYRAAESDRPDALFHDPYARRLAGERGRQIAESMPVGVRVDWPWVARTYLFDQFIVEQLRQGVDMVVNLAAGLDARPYRMDLPSSLRWIEVDLPGILSYKEEVLAGEKPRCALERVRLDLSDTGARRELFSRLDRQARQALILTEGLLIYLTAAEVAALARDLAAPQAFQSWILDLASPGLLRLLQKNIGPQLSQASAALKFGPPEGPGFFVPYGWQPVRVCSPLKTAARFKRLTFALRLFALLPESQGRQGSRPWSGICLLRESRLHASVGGSQSSTRLPSGSSIQAKRP